MDKSSPNLQHHENSFEELAWCSETCPMPWWWGFPPRVAQSVLEMMLESTSFTEWQGAVWLQSHHWLHSFHTIINCYITMENTLLLYHFNLLWPSDTRWYQVDWVTLVQVMACPHYLNVSWLIVNWTLRHKLPWNSNLEIRNFHSKKCFEKKNLPAECQLFCSGFNMLQYLINITMTS